MRNVGYQTFSQDEPAGSPSFQKLAAIQLPEDLTGKSVLDIGCNEGFFCYEAKRRGAAYVLGVDNYSPFLEAARARRDALGLDVDFRLSDGSDLPDRKFDVILVLSMLHYVTAPRRMFEAILEHLNPGGLLILECGVSEYPGRTLTRVVRRKGDLFYPSMELLERFWLQGFAVRHKGPSVDQGGDPVPRQVFHCKPIETTVAFLTGAPGKGKTALAASIADAVVITMDNIVSSSKYRFSSAGISAEQKLFDNAKRAAGGSIGAGWRRTRGNTEVRAFFARKTADAVRQCAPAKTIIIEGYMAGDLAPDIKALLGPGYRYWMIAAE